MSYDIYIYDKSAKSMDIESESFGQEKMPIIPMEHVEKFKERLLKYDYKITNETTDSLEYEHKNKEWGVQVSIFKTEISFSIPFWDDVEEAVFEALMTASELCDHGELVVFDPQNNGWVDA